MSGSRVRRITARIRRTPGLGAAIVIVAAGLAWESYALFVPSPPLRAAGRHVIAIDEFPSDTPVGQTFRAPADALEWVRLQFSSDQPAEMQLRCWLLTASNNGVAEWAELFNWTTMVRLPAGRSWHQFDFVPVVRSEKKIYQFRVRAMAVRALTPGSSPPSVNLIGSRDNSLDEGGVVVGADQRTTQDLLFQAGFSDDLFSELRREVPTHLPRWLRDPLVQLAILGAYNLAFIVFAGALLMGETGPTT